MGWGTALVGKLGAWFIYRLIQLFGRTHRWEEVPWLVGPLGGNTIGEAPYREVAAAEDLSVERRARNGGLIPSFSALRGERFDPSRLHPLVQEFYERTSEFAMDVWSKTYFPTSIGLTLLVTTISRQVDQLNFPLSPLDTALGMTSEIILMRKRDGAVRYTGWLRTLAHTQRVIYTGFYLSEQTPNEPGPSVKVVFPMPNGNATVLLRPEHERTGRSPSSRVVVGSATRGSTGSRRADPSGSGSGTSAR